MIVSALFLISAVLGYRGFLAVAPVETGGTHLDAAYRTLQLFFVDLGTDGSIGWELEVARFLAPVATLLTAIGAVLAFAGSSLDLGRIRLLRGHAIVCGSGYVPTALALRLRTDGWDVVFLTEGGTVAGGVRDTGVLVLPGNPRDPTNLARAGLHRAAHLVVMTGDDASNASLAIAAQSHHAARTAGAAAPRRLGCLVQLSSSSLVDAIRGRLDATRDDTFRFDFIDIDSLGARALLQRRPPMLFRPTSAPLQPRVLFLGTGRFTTHLLRQVVREWRLDHPATGIRFTALVAGQGASSIAAQMQPDVADACVIEPLSLPPDLRMLRPADLQGVLDALGDRGSIYVSADTDGESVLLGLSLAREIEAGRATPTGQAYEITIATLAKEGVAELLPTAQDREPADGLLLGTFPLVADAIAHVLLVGEEHERIGREIHELYRRERLSGDAMLLPDEALRDWADLSPNLRQSNRLQALDIGRKLQTLGYATEKRPGTRPPITVFTPAEIDHLAQLEHARWIDERLAAGWAYGPERDDERKLRPSLVSWEILPEEEREKDREAVRSIPALIDSSGRQIVRASDPPLPHYRRLTRHVNAWWNHVLRKSP